MDTTDAASDTPYVVHICGALDPPWSYWFDGMAIRHNADSTATLVGSVVDQAAWYGLIGKARDSA